MYQCNTCKTKKSFRITILENQEDQLHAEVVMRCDTCNRRGFEAEGVNNVELRENTKKLQQNRRTAQRCLERAAELGETDEARLLEKRAKELWNCYS